MVTAVMVGMPMCRAVTVVMVARAGCCSGGAATVVRAVRGCWWPPVMVAGVETPGFWRCGVMPVAAAPVVRG